MDDLAREPSMEDILASIKRIIAEDGAPAPRPRRTPRAPADPAELAASFRPLTPSRVEAVDDDEPVLELTETVDPEPERAPDPVVRTAEAPREVEPEPVAEPATPTPIVSDTAAHASRHALAALSALVVKPAPGQENTLDGLVREMLRPMLKQWLDANLPDMVESMVSREIQRITGQAI